MHYYAYENRYGVGTRSAYDLSRIGCLHIFESRADRDAWVDADVWDGHYKREPLTAREAMPYLAETAAHVTFKAPGECRARGVDWMCAAISDYRKTFSWDVD